MGDTTSQHLPGRRRRAHRATLAVAMAASLFVSASAAGSSAGSGTAPAAAATAAAPEPAADRAQPPPESFTGEVDDFYRVPDDLPRGKAGQLIRVQDLGEAGGYRTLRVMYHSRDRRNHDRAVTGIISHPTGPAPEGGWPVVSWAHGTTGLASQCAPSRAGRPAPGFGIEGVHVATDYVGLGPVGERHPYLSGVTEARGVVDAVRAARRLPDAHAGTAWVAVGHSQGGHAALFTNEVGQTYAPELDLRGTVAIAPAAVLDRTFGPGDQVIPHMVGAMALYGWEADYPQIDAGRYVSPAVDAIDDVVDEGCSNEIILAFLGVPLGDFYDHHPLETPPARPLVRENDPGHVAVDAPLLLVSGSVDNFVVTDRVRYLFDQLCDVGQVAALLEVEGADHGSVVPLSGSEVTGWFEARLAGEPAPDDCLPAG